MGVAALRVSKTVSSQRSSLGHHPFLEKVEYKNDWKR